MTDTARYADVLLPATTFLEGYDIARGYGPISLRLGKPVIEPVGEARSNADVFGELLRLLGRRTKTATRAASSRRCSTCSAQLPAADRRRAARAAARRRRRSTAGRFSSSTSCRCTPDGKVDLFPAAARREAPAGLYGYQPDPATAEFPLALISPASERTISSTLAELPRPDVRLLMHPDDAAARGLEDGDAVRIFNELGEVRCNVQVGAWIRPGTVSLPKGLWRKHTANGYTATRSRRTR